MNFRGFLLVALLFPVLWCWAVSDGFLCLSAVSPLTCGRPLPSHSHRLSFPTCHSPSVTFSLCRPRTPASAPTLASRTASTARRRAAGQRRWTSTVTRCTSATILTRRYGLICCSFLWWCFFGFWGDCGNLEHYLHTDRTTRNIKSC